MCHRVNRFAQAISLVVQMLSSDAFDRPDIGVVESKLLELLDQSHSEGHRQVKFLIDYLKKQASCESLEADWPHLANRWKWFIEEFGNRT